MKKTDSGQIAVATVRHLAEENARLRIALQSIVAGHNSGMRGWQLAEIAKIALDTR